MSKLPREDTINTCLADVICEFAGDPQFAIPEDKTIKRKRFDIKINYNTFDIILEASYDKNDAIEDAKKRIEEGLIDTISIAVYYNPSFFENKLSVSDIKKVLKQKYLEIKVFGQGQDISRGILRFIKESKVITRDWIKIRVNQILVLLQSIEEFLVKEDIFQELLQNIEDKVNNFIDFFNTGFQRNPTLKSKVIESLYITLFSPTEDITGLIIADVPNEVIIAHSYLSLLLASILYESIADKHGKDPFQVLLNKHKNVPIYVLKEAYTEILAVNYEPAFDGALAVLNCYSMISVDSQIWDHFRDLIITATYIVGNRTLLRQDFIGYIYHKITGNIRVRKSFATYYTKHPIAYLLAFLTILNSYQHKIFKWENLEQFKKLYNVCDFACGSGTLLTATYEALLSLYQKQCYERKMMYNPDEFHKLMIKDSIWGFDALEHAVQTASIVLSLKNPDVPLQRINTYQVILNESGSLGSLNYWWSKSQIIPIKRRDIEKVSEEEVIIPLYNVVIMNPPFSRTTAPGETGSRPRIFDFVLNEKSFDKLWKNYTKLITDLEDSFKKKRTSSEIIISEIYNEYVGKGKIFRSQDINPLNAGASLPFVFLADKYLKPYGSLVLVLPKTTIESSAYFLLRLLLLANYHIEFLILSTELGNENFSYSTGLSEVLIIARKLKSARDLNNKETCLLKIRRQPKNTLEAILMARAISNKLNENNSTSSVKVQSAEAEIFKLKRETLREYIWNFSLFLNPESVLGEFIIGLSKKNVLGLNIPLFSLKTLKDNDLKIDITSPRTFRGKQFESAFDITSTSQYKILNRAGKDIFNIFLLQSNLTTSIRPKNKEAQEKYQEKAAGLFIPESIGFNAIPLISIFSSKKIISSNAFMLKSSRKIEKAISIWLNSSFVISYLNAIFSTIKGSYGHIRSWHIRVCPFPDLNNMTLVDLLNNIFTKYQNIAWDILPEQYEAVLNGADKTRLNFDLEILETLANIYNITFNEDNLREKLLIFYRDIMNTIK